MKAVNEQQQRRVFVPHIPSRWNHKIEGWEPTVNINGARKFGEMIVLLPDDASRMHAAPVVQALREKIDDIRADDFIVAVGDPTVLAMTVAVAALKTGGQINLLKWDKQMGMYIPVHFKI